jgi:hypothetical protein
MKGLSCAFSDQKTRLPVRKVGVNEFVLVEGQGRKQFVSARTPQRFLAAVQSVEVLDPIKPIVVDDTLVANPEEAQDVGPMLLESVQHIRWNSV